MSTFSKEQIEAVKLLYDAAKVFIPVVIGYIVFFSGSIGYLWKDDKETLSKSLIVHAGVTLLFGIISLGIWSGTIPFCIRSMQYVDISLFEYGKACAQGGHVLFFLSVLSGVLFYLRIFILHTAEKDVKRTKSD